MDDAASSGGSPRFDAVALRVLLDALRSGLSSRGNIIPDIPAPIGTQGPLVGAVQDVLNALASRSFPAHRVLSEISAVVQSADQTAMTLDLLNSVSAKWTERTIGILGPRKIQSLKRFLDGPVPDFLGLLDLADDENRHSAMLRWMLDPRCAPTIGPATLLALVSRLDNADDWTTELRTAFKADTLSVRREYTIAVEWTDESRLERIDLVVSSPRFILAIENKLWAREHGEQTQRYWAWLERLPILRAGVFLSPSGRPPASTWFKPMSYLEMLSCLLEAPSASDLTIEEEILMASYAKTLAAGVLGAELRAIQRGGASQ